MNLLYIGIDLGILTCDIGILLIVLFGVCMVFTMSSKVRKQIFSLLSCIILANVFELVSNLCELFPGKTSHGVIIFTVFMCHVMIEAAVLIMSAYTCDSMEKPLPYPFVWKVIAFTGVLYFLLLIMNLFTGTFYAIDDLNVYDQTALYVIFITLLQIPCYLNCMILTAPQNKTSADNKKGIIFFFVGPILSGLISAVDDKIDYFYMILTFSCLILLFYVISVESRKSFEREQQLKELNMKLFLARLRPHFLFNALSTISQLSRKRPREAGELLDHFSEYLRINIKDLQEKEFVSFQSEMELVDHYLEIENARFGELLWVDFDLNELEFLVPPMVILPLVENGITHGIGVMEEGGCIFIGSESIGDLVKIVVEDDGAGFDVEEVLSRDPNSILNDVINRINAIHQASIEIESEPGRGCRITILLPKRPAGRN